MREQLVKVEEVVNAILEGNLAPHLAKLDQSMERQPKPPEEQALPDIQGRGRMVYYVQSLSIMLVIRFLVIVN